MTENELFERIKADELRLAADQLTILYYHRSHRRWKTKIPDQHPISGRYRFRFGKARTTVYRNRLIWMLTKNRLIPTEMCVDHIDGDRLNDHPTNLQLMRDKDSHLQGLSIQQQSYYQECCDYFDAICILGHEPRWATQAAGNFPSDHRGAD